MNRQFGACIFGLVAAKLLAGSELPAQVNVDLSIRTPSGIITEEVEAVRFGAEITGGQLLVTARRRSTPLLADFASDRLLAVSREGDGPGEFRRPLAVLQLAHDSIIVAEESGNRWVILKEAEPVATLRALSRGTMAVILAGADTLGRVLELRATRMGTEPGQRVYLSHTNAESLAVLLRTRSAIASGLALSSRADTIAHLRGAFRGIRNRHLTPPGANFPVEYHLSQPLAGEEQALLFRDGWIAFAYLDPYRVTWRTPEGRLIEGPNLPFVAIPVDEAQRSTAIGEAWPTGSAPFSARDYPPWPRVLPPFLVRSLLAMPDGRLAIKRTVDARKPGVYYDIVDRNGRLAGTIRVGAGERILTFGIENVYTVRSDADGLHTLIRYDWPQ